MFDRKLIYHGKNDNSFRSTLVTATKKDYEKFQDYLIARYQNSVLLDFNCSDPLELNRPISLEYSFKAQDYGQRVSDLWILPSFFSALNEKEFALRQRIHPLRFDTIYVVEHYVEIEMPDNYEVYHLPSAFECDNKFIRVAIGYRQSGKKIILDFRSHSKTTHISPVDYRSIKLDMQKLNKHCLEQIVLRKKHVH